MCSRMYRCVTRMFNSRMYPCGVLVKIHILATRPSSNDGTHSDVLGRLCLHPHHSSSLQEQIKKKRNYKSIVFNYFFRVNAYQVWALTTSSSTKMQENGNHSFISESWFAARSWSGNDIGVSPPPSPHPAHTHTHTPKKAIKGER